MQTTMLLEEQPIWLVNIGEKTMKYDMKENNKIMLLSIKPWNLLLDFMVKKKKKKLNSKDWGRGKHSSPLHITKAKLLTNLQNSYPSESSENWVVCKSYNHGVKEVTPIQLDRRGGDTEVRNR